MELPKNYDHLAKDEACYNKWQEQGFFHSEPDERVGIFEQHSNVQVQVRRGGGEEAEGVQEWEEEE